MLYFLMIALVGVSFFIQWRLRSKFEEYSHFNFKGNLSGAEIAAKMLRDNNITDVKVISVEGQLTDHYNPADKTVNLSIDVYNGRSVAAAAVAAHECGHAVQYARGYAWIVPRSKLVPVLSIVSGWMQWILLAGIVAITIFQFPYLLLIGIVLFSFTTLFAFITLPVEFDASKRALAWLESSGMTEPKEHDMAYDALKWAALTYVVAAISSLVTLFYYISIFLGNQRRNNN